MPIPTAILLGFVIPVLIIHGSCGTKVGNPGSSDVSANLPEVDESLTESEEFALSTRLQPGGETRQPPRLDLVARRLNIFLNDTEEILASLRSENVSGIGRHKGKGTEKNISLEIFSADDSEVFDYYAGLCSEGSWFMDIAWTEAEDLIRFTHNFKIRAGKKRGTLNLLAEVLVETGEASTGIKSWAYTVEDDLPDFEVDGNVRIEHISAQYFGNRDYTITTVGDWAEAEPDSNYSQTVGDEYLVGELLDAGTKEYVEYIKNHESCGEFDPTNTANPGWCVGRKLGRDSPDPYTQEQIDTAWTDRLSQYGIPDASMLRAPIRYFADDDICATVDG